jgi:AraC-like DNA-binding protein
MSVIGKTRNASVQPGDVPSRKDPWALAPPRSLSPEATALGTENDSGLLTKNAYLQGLARVLDHHTIGFKGGEQFATAIKGFSIVRSERSVQAVRRASGLAMCMIVQGAEWEMVSSRRCDYRAGQAFIFSVEERSRCTAPLASPMHPYLGLVIELDRAYMQQMIEELGSCPTPEHKGNRCGSHVLDLSRQLLDCVLRGIRLLDTPEAIPLLYPGIMCEMCYWLLTGPACGQIIELTKTTAQDKRVLQAIQHLRGNFTNQIRVEELANAAGMSAATFHRQFKSVTTVSPLQYQKQLRLLEARRLMIVNASNVETVAFEVGYVSASQFSREYTRMFGKSPRRDMSASRSFESFAPYPSTRIAVGEL